LSPRGAAADRQQAHCQKGEYPGKPLPGTRRASAGTNGVLTRHQCSYAAELRPYCPCLPHVLDTLMPVYTDRATLTRVATLVASTL